MDAKTVILDAVERLCVERSPSRVTMRQIAAEAGVSVGFAYHHFASKDELFGRVLDRIAADITDGIDPGEDPVAVLDELRARLRKRPAFVRLIASLILEGKDVSSMMTGHPLIQNVAARAAEAGHPDPPAAAATLALLAFAGELFGPPLNHAIGRPRSDEALFDALKRLLET